MSNAIETAASYVAKVYSGEISSRDCQELEYWLSEDEQHLYEYQRMLNIWDALAAYPVMKNKTSNSQRSFSKWLTHYKLVAIAASFCLLALTVFLSLSVSEKSEPLLTRYQTLVGQQKTINLSDGSKVMLNTDTLLKVDFRDGKRKLKLEFGEAFFDVAKDPDNPMDIDLISHKVTVLGTKFNIYRSDVEIKVAVVEGKVSVNTIPVNATSVNTTSVNTRNEQAITKKTDDINKVNDLANDSKVLLTAGDVINVTTNNETTKIEEPIVVAKKIDIKKFTDWHEGLIRFDNQPLFRVVSELNRYSQHKILLEDKKIMTLPVSGVFRFNDIEAILEALDSGLAVTIVRYSDRYVILGD